LTLAQQEAINPIVTLLVRDGLKVTIDASQLTDRQIGVILKVFQEAHQSGKLDGFLRQYTANGNDIEIRFASSYINLKTGVVTPFTDFVKPTLGYVQYESTRENTVPNGSHFPQTGVTVYIAINSSLVQTERDFAITLIHELSHAFEPGDDV
jgi:hypothetical protein